MEFNEEHARTLGKLEAGMDSVHGSVQRIENAIIKMADTHREDNDRVNSKADKAHSRMDKIEKDFASSKAKMTGFAAGITALWTFIMHWIKGE